MQISENNCCNNKIATTTLQQQRAYHAIFFVVCICRQRNICRSICYITRNRQSMFCFVLCCYRYMLIWTNSVCNWFSTLDQVGTILTVLHMFVFFVGPSIPYFFGGGLFLRVCTTMYMHSSCTIPRRSIFMRMFFLRKKYGKEKRVRSGAKTSIQNKTLSISINLPIVCCVATIHRWNEHHHEHVFCQSHICRHCLRVHGVPIFYLFVGGTSRIFTTCWACLRSAFQNKAARSLL